MVVLEMVIDGDEPQEMVLFVLNAIDMGFQS